MHNPASRPATTTLSAATGSPPVEGQYFDNVSPVTGKPFCQIARSGAADIELALDAAHKAAKDAWGRTSVTERSNILLKIADRIEANLENARRRRDLGQRQGGARDAERRHTAGG
jgi:acyl-CoA reductase-like NAD-dependent aldehyde dehydrogenase